MKLFIRLYTEHISVETTQKVMEGDSNISYYAMIVHNKDILPSGELKKEHIHLIMEYDTNQHISSKQLMNRLFTENQLSGCDIQNVRNMKNVARYLTHKDNLEKAQYEDFEVITNDMDTYQELIQSQLKVGKDEMKLNMIVDYVESLVNKGFTCNTRDIAKYCRSQGIGDYYIKHKGYILSYIGECLDTIIQ